MKRPLQWRSNPQKAKGNETTEIKVVLLQTGNCDWPLLLLVATGFCYCYWLLTTSCYCYCYWLPLLGPATCCKAGQKFKVFQLIFLRRLYIKREGQQIERGNRKGKGKPARNGSRKNIQPHKASLLACLRCRVSGANDAPVIRAPAHGRWPVSLQEAFGGKPKFKS